MQIDCVTISSGGFVVNGSTDAEVFTFAIPADQVGNLVTSIFSIAHAAAQYEVAKREAERSA